MRSSFGPGKAFLYFSLLKTVRKRRGFGGAPLWHAVEHRYVELVCLLTEKGADVNSVDNKGQPLLWYAIQRKGPSSDRRGWDREIRGEEIARLVLDKGAIVDMDDIRIKLQNLGIFVPRNQTLTHSLGLQSWTQIFPLPQGRL
jgi:Ankyrin repeats (many copies)